MLLVSNATVPHESPTPNPQQINFVGLFSNLPLNSPTTVQQTSSIAPVLSVALSLFLPFMFVVILFAMES